MILGFGNNVVSALASEITASQKTIPVMPGSGAKFAELLTQDNDNPSTELDVFAKITLTDSGETEFEICHLLSVSGDVLSVVRGQEGTPAKGWMLNDVVANFATRGSENQFVQIDQLQSGFYCAGVAGGTANTLTLTLPSSSFLNSATDWVLRTPVIVYPAQNNTGAATLQLILGGKALGTFPLYKGDKAQLVAGDILKDVALVCMLDKSQTFFSVMNPGAIYAGLGTAAYRDVTTSRTDTTAGHVLQAGDYGLGVDNGSVTFLNSIYDIKCSGEYNALGDGTSTPTTGIPEGSGNTRFAVSAGNIYGNQYLVTLTSNVHFYVGLVNTSAKTSSWSKFYNTSNKPSASDVDAVSAANGGTFQKEVIFNNGVALGTSRTGLYNGGDAAGYTTNNVLLKSWFGIGFYCSLTDANENETGLTGYINTRNGRLEMKEQIIPGNYTNFDARYNLKNTAGRAANGWFKDSSTGMIFQWGTSNRRDNSTSQAYPIAFPSTCLAVIGSLAAYVSDLDDSKNNIHTRLNNNSSFVWDAGSAENKIMFFAIGY